jgi:hypothetical protein
MAAETLDSYLERSRPEQANNTTTSETTGSQELPVDLRRQYSGNSFISMPELQTDLTLVFI